jgi:hypothetical protein
MSGFNDREQGFEKAFAHGEKLSFEVEARCCKLFGLWAAEKLGYSGDAAKAYAMEVVGANLDEPGFDDVMRKVQADLKEKNIVLSNHMMEVELEKALTLAREQIMTEKK